ncbi:hypothetical protein OG215_38310 (plasmid) [Streptomyces globisporus]|uniref:hypothetical protein n=1 Tax=Streptomyces globisporus TaxID=1908 RepID=UPI002F91B1FE|nr:hypothetical protein OG215_38310 [Streptomyces globisporus]
MPDTQCGSTSDTSTLNSENKAEVVTRCRVDPPPVSYFPSAAAVRQPEATLPTVERSGPSWGEYAAKLLFEVAPPLIQTGAAFAGNSTVRGAGIVAQALPYAMSMYKDARYIYQGDLDYPTHLNKTSAAWSIASKTAAMAGSASWGTGVIKKDHVLTGTANSVTAVAAGIEKIVSAESWTSKVVGAACEFIPLETVAISAYRENEKIRSVGIGTLALGGVWEVIEEFRKIGATGTPNDPQPGPQMGKVLGGCAKIAGAAIWAVGTWHGDSRAAGSGLTIMTVAAGLREGGFDKLHRPDDPERATAARSSVPNPPQAFVTAPRPSAPRSTPATAVTRAAASPTRR